MTSETSLPLVADPRDVFVNFTATEVFWREHQEFLQSKGYMLRRRYRPGWVPSWKTDPTMKILDAEDRLSFQLGQSHLMDAIRLSDERMVMLKKVRSDSRELHIATFLRSDGLEADPRNHSVPILDHFEDPEDPNVTFIVMPFLRYVNDPYFDTVGSVLTCVEQLLEGLVFLHEHNVAHRDCAYKNIMMDASSMFPCGFHPIANMSLPDSILVSAPILPRSTVPVTYYYVDFGISTLFRESDTNRLVTGLSGLDRDVPELSDDVPYDPFKVDIFVLGNFFREAFLETYSNVDMLAPIVRSMLAPNPADRPSASEVLQHFRMVKQGIWAIRRLWRVRIRREPLVFRPILDTISLLSIAFRAVFGPM